MIFDFRWSTLLLALVAFEQTTFFIAFHAEKSIKMEKKLQVMSTSRSRHPTSGGEKFAI
jgi:hypothetical protein